MTRILLYATLISCLVSAILYVYIRFHRTPKEDKWYDTIIYILWPLLATCVGVVFALWIDRDETSRRQREATVKTLTLCVLDANNTLELIGRAADTAAKHNDGTPSLDTYRKARTLLERFGMPYPDVIQSLLLSESTLTNCSTAYLETVMRELNKLKQLKATMNREMPDEMFFRCIDSYHIALEEILDLTCNEINYINGLMSQSSHDRQIDIVMQGERRTKLLDSNARLRSQILEQDVAQPDSSR